MRIWEINKNTKEQIKPIEKLGHESRVNCTYISKDSRLIVTGGTDNKICLWEKESGRLLQEIKKHTGSVESVAISQDKKYIVSSSSD
jgi:WD40 repeat protein